MSEAEAIVIDVPAEEQVDAGVPAAEQPVESRKRERKKSVDLYKVEVKENVEFVIKQGKGLKIADIPNASHQLSKLKSDDDLVVQMHQLLFKRTATANKRKRNILAFSGFAFGDQEAKEIERTKEKLAKWHVPTIHQALDLFDLPRGNGDDNKKESKLARLMEFLDKPSQLSDKDMAATEAQKKVDVKAKKERMTAKKEKIAAKKNKAATPASKTKVSKAEKVVEEEDEEDEEADEVDEEDEEEEAEEAPSAKKAKKVATPKSSSKPSAPSTAEKAKKAATPKKTPVEKKSPAVAKTPASPKSKAKGDKKVAKETADDAEADVAGPSAPAAAAAVEEKEAKAPGTGSKAALPSDEDLTAALSEVLKDVPVDTINVRMCMKLLKPVYEGVNLSSKKAFIKEAACAYISVKHTQTPAAAEGAPEKCGGEDDEMAQAVEESASETAAAAGPTADAPVEEAAGTSASAAAPPATTEPITTESSAAAAQEPVVTDAPAAIAVTDTPSATTEPAVAEAVLGEGQAEDGAAVEDAAVIVERTHTEKAEAEVAAAPQPIAAEEAVMAAE